MIHSNTQLDPGTCPGPCVEHSFAKRQRHLVPNGITVVLSCLLVELEGTAAGVGGGKCLQPVCAGRVREGSEEDKGEGGVKHPRLRHQVVTRGAHTATTPPAHHRATCTRRTGHVLAGACLLAAPMGAGGGVTCSKLASSLRHLVALTGSS